MSRDLEAALVTEITASKLRPVCLFEFLFRDGDVRFWNGLGDLTALSQTFTGSGTLLAVSDYEETQSLEAQGLKFTLSGIPSNILSLSLDRGQYYNRECAFYFGALDDAGVLVSEPYKQFSGFMDVMEITEAGETCSIEINAENKMLILNRKKDRRYTPEDQKIYYPSDLGFDFVPTMQDKEIIWKAKA